MGDIVTEGGSVLACHPGDLPGDEEESQAAEDKVPPLVSVSLELWTM